MGTSKSPVRSVGLKPGESAHPQHSEKLGVKPTLEQEVSRHGFALAVRGIIHLGDANQLTEPNTSRRAMVRGMSAFYPDTHMNAVQEDSQNIDFPEGSPGHIVRKSPNAPPAHDPRPGLWVLSDESSRRGPRRRRNHLLPPFARMPSESGPESDCRVLPWAPASLASVPAQARSFVN